MNKKNTVKKTAALLLGVALAAGGVGCGNFIVTDNAKDLAQTVATVNISKQLEKDAKYQSVAPDVAEIVKRLSTDISKRDLVAYFLSTGYQYVENYGYTYEQTFEMLMDGLVDREIMIQYALAYYLKNKPALTKDGCDAYIASELAAAKQRSAKEESLLKAHPEVLTLKYFLTENGTKAKEYELAEYQLKKSLNSSLDSIEAGYIKEEKEEAGEDTTAARTLPNGVNTEDEEYIPEGYDVYTGRNTLDSCKGYEKLDGSTTSTRRKAYNAFLNNLQAYNMIGTSGGEEDTSNVKLLDYYYVELSSVLGQSIINAYFEELEKEVTDSLDAAYAANPNDSYMTDKYNEIYEAQKKSYEKAPAKFATAMDGVSDNSFLLYGLKNFGYVYNILLPFSTEQNVEYTEAKNNSANKQEDLFKARRRILEEVKGSDQRGSWISADKEKNYSYTVGEGEEKKYYFFEDNFSAEANSKYEKLKQYAGTYPFNGTVTETDGKLETSTKGHELNIDEFLTLMKTQIEGTVGNSVTVTQQKNINNGSDNKGIAKLSDPTEKYTKYNTSKYTNDKNEIDYSSFIYSVGKVEGLTATAADYFNPETDVYKVVSAVNELMFAYSTDTGCLNTYFGYAVSPYKTNFVKEFEYAAQEAVKGGVGTYVVCATDYGWHIMFASYVYDGGDVYGGYNAADKETEGSFSNIFYDAMKASAGTSYTTEVQNTVLNNYNNDSVVELFKSRYKDLMELGQ